jgi:recombination associated protein RdgC
MRISAIHCFQLQQALADSPEQLEAQLERRKARACPGHEMETMGWSSPFGSASSVLCHSVNGCWLMCVQHEKRLLPPAVVQDLLREKIDTMRQEGQSISRKEKQHLKEDIEATLMPKAFVKREQTMLYFDTHAQRLVVCSSRRAHVDQIVTLLRHTVGHLSLTPLSTAEHTTRLMTEWLHTGTPPANLQLGTECQMIDRSKSHGRIQFTHHGLNQNSVLQHLKEGKIVAQLALSLPDTLTFKFNQDFSFTGIKWLDQITEHTQPKASEDAAQALDASFVILSGILNQMITQLLQTFKTPSAHIQNTQKEALT